MAISPIGFFQPDTAVNAAADVQSFANLTALSNLTGLSPTTLTTFSGTLGQVLAALGPLGLDTTLTGTGTTAVPNVNTVVLPLQQPNRDFYRFGIGLDAVCIFTKIFSSSSSCPATGSTSQ